MSDIAWLFVAFLAVWAAIGAYLLSIQARQRELERKIEQLRQRGSKST